MNAHPGFPVEYLRGFGSALCLFSAAFGGYNVEAHLYAIGMRDVTCVDLDAAKLADMAPAFPEWRFECADAFTYAGSAELVTLDPWASLSTRVVADIEHFARMADRRLIVNVNVGDVSPKPRGMWLVASVHVNAKQRWVVYDRC